LGKGFVCVYGKFEFVLHARDEAEFNYFIVFGCFSVQRTAVAKGQLPPQMGG